MALALAGLEAAGTAKEDPLSHANQEPLVIICGRPKTDDRFAFLERSAHRVRHTCSSIDRTVRSRNRALRVPTRPHTRTPARLNC